MFSSKKINIQMFGKFAFCIFTCYFLFLYRHHQLDWTTSNNIDSYYIFAINWKSYSNCSSSKEYYYLSISLKLKFPLEMRLLFEKDHFPFLSLQYLLTCLPEWQLLSEWGIIGIDKIIIIFLKRALARPSDCESTPQIGTLNEFSSPFLLLHPNYP